MSNKYPNLAIGTAAVFIVLLLCIGKFFIMVAFECGHNQDTLVTRLDAGDDRAIWIFGDSCWEVGRGLYYVVRDHGKTVSSKSFFDTDEGDKHDYSLLFANNNSLVAVLDMTRKPPEIALTYDFSSNDTLTAFVGTEGAWRYTLRQLQNDNPQVDPKVFNY